MALRYFSYKTGPWSWLWELEFHPSGQLEVWVSGQGCLWPCLKCNNIFNILSFVSSKLSSVKLLVEHHLKQQNKPWLTLVMEQVKTKETMLIWCCSAWLHPPPCSGTERRRTKRGDGGERGSRYCYNVGGIEGGDIPNYNKKARSSLPIIFHDYRRWDIESLGSSILILA